MERVVTQNQVLSQCLTDSKDSKKKSKKTDILTLADGKFFIQSNNGLSQVSVYSSLGVNLIKVSTNDENYILDLTRFPSGIYILELFTLDGKEYKTVFSN
ncbi:MAG: T9SS type A sorting domain-containing protein [Saprospiraceae bacterium]|nr:T9SS type A sorting domain-containing protein [Candidatus Vicinibacter affinis]